MFTVQYKKHFLGGTFDRQVKINYADFNTWNEAAIFAMELKLTDESEPMRGNGHNFYATDVLVVPNCSKIETNC